MRHVGSNVRGCATMRSGLDMRAGVRELSLRSCIWLVVTLLGIGLTVAGCAARGGAARGGMEALRAAAEREAAGRPATLVDVPPPPSLKAIFGGEQEDQTGHPTFTSRQSFDEVLAILAAKRGAAQPPTLQPPTEADRVLAVKLYAAGREKLITGSPGEAALTLRQVVRLDPTSGEAWMALADAEMSLGARAEAIASLRRAVDLGLETARAREILGRDAMARGHLEEAAEEFARSLALLDAQADPALRYLVKVQLGQTLAGLRADRAAREALLRGIDLPEVFTQPTVYRNDIVSLYRRRPEVLTMAADLSCRLGEFEAALDLYVRARQYGEMEGAIGASREVYALVRSGRPRAGANLLVGRVAAAGGWIDEDAAELIEWFAAHTSVGDELGAALQDLATQLEKPTPTVLSRLMLARTALASEDRAIAMIAAHLHDDPWDADAMAALVELCRGAPTERLVRSVVRAAAGSATASGLAAQTLLMSGRDDDELLRAFGRSEVDLAVRACLLTDLGRDVEALDAIESLATRRGLHAAVATARVAATLGRWLHAERAIDAIRRAPASPERDKALVAALSSVQRFNEALEAIRSRADAGATDENVIEAVHVLRAAVDAALAARSPADAERWARRWLSIDPRSEQAHSRLLSALYATSPPDTGAIEDALRSLRRANPDGRLIRMVQGRELMSRGLRVQAERVLVEAATRHTHDTSLLEMLSAVWDEMIERGDAEAVDRAEAWIRTHLAVAPNSPMLVSMLARVLAASGRAAEAELMLATRTRVSPIPELARLRERVLREGMDRSSEAERATLARLMGPRRGIEEAIELADLHVRRGDLPAADEVLREGVPALAILTAEQQSVLAFVLDRAATAAGADARSPNLAMMRSDSTPREAVIGLFGTVVEHGALLPPSLHASRILLLCSRQEIDVPEVVSAVSAACDQHPTLSADFVQGAVGVLAAMGDERATLAVLADVGVRGPSTKVLEHWLRLVASSGRAIDGRRLVEAAHASNLAVDLLRVFQEAPPTEPAKASAEVAYLLGQVFYANSLDDDAAEMYRLALSIDPEHGWAANNLGYHLIDKDVPTPAEVLEAERLLLLAIRLLPEESSVLDSLGWLRYKQGMVRSERDSSGSVQVEGAVSLLRRASEGRDGQDNATILDHLGDALWVAGERESAIAAWERAATAAVGTINRLRQQTGTVRAREETEALLASIRGKLAAAMAGESPRVSAHAGEP